jgi:hypothetical protein
MRNLNHHYIDPHEKTEEKNSLAYGDIISHRSMSTPEHRHML